MGMFSAPKKFTGCFGFWASDYSVTNAMMREVQGIRWTQPPLQPWLVKKGFFGESPDTWSRSKNQPGVRGSGRKRNVLGIDRNTSYLIFFFVLSSVLQVFFIGHILRLCRKNFKIWRIAMAVSFFNFVRFLFGFNYSLHSILFCIVSGSQHSC